MKGQRHAPVALYPRERPGTHCTGGWMGPRAGLDRCGKSCPPPGFDPRTAQPVASRYTHWATRPTICLYCFFTFYSFCFHFFVSMLFLLPAFSLIFFTTCLSTQTIWFRFLEVLMRNILVGGARGVAADWGTALQTEVAGSIPDGVVWIFHWHNPSGLTMALG